MNEHYLQQLANRLQRLEDIEAIKKLKAVYLAASDDNDIEAFRNCFATGEIHLDYGHMGVYKTRDDVTQLFEEVGCHEHLLDMHLGTNPRIEITGEDSAQGTWTLYFQDIDLEQHRFIQLGMQYDDEYVRTPQGWRIKKSVVRVMSTLITSFAEDKLMKVTSARKRPDYMVGSE